MRAPRRSRVYCARDRRVQDNLGRHFDSLDLGIPFTILLPDSRCQTICGPRFSALHGEVGVELPARGGTALTTSWPCLGADGLEMLDAGELLQLTQGLETGDGVVEAGQTN
jgi:hypothetical protein